MMACLDNDRFVTGNDDGYLRLWTVEKRRPISTVLRSHGYVNRILRPPQGAVASAVYDLEGGGAPSRWNVMHGPINLADAHRLGMSARAALKDCADDVLSRAITIGKIGRGGGRVEPSVISEFGELANAAVRQYLVAFNDATGQYLLKHLPVVQRIHRDLMHDMYEDLGEAYKTQIDLLRRSCLQ